MFDRLAHDLRGPLTPLQTAAFLLRRGELEPARQQELLHIIDRQTTRLAAMVQEPADWQSAEQGRLRTREDATELGMLVGLACESAPSPLGITIDLADAVSRACIAGDAQRLSQMLATLLAFAQARAGESTISVSGVVDGRDAVLDIRAAHHPPVGSPHPDADIFLRPEAVPFDDGLGWRLMIASAIARAHGGVLRADAAGDSDAARHSIRLRVHLPTHPAS